MTADEFQRLTGAEPERMVELERFLVMLTETNAVLSTGGTLSLTDLDATAATVVAQTGTAGSYGSFAISSAGVWTYTTSSALLQQRLGKTAA